MAIGAIKRQKQRPGAERIQAIFEKNRGKVAVADETGTLPTGGIFFTGSGDGSLEAIKAKLDEMVARQLLTRVNIGGAYSYREVNSAIPIVAINNPIKTRVHLVPEEGKLWGSRDSE